MSADAVVHRDEIVGTLFTIAEINAKLGRILDLLEEELGGEGEVPEEDA